MKAANDFLSQAQDTIGDRGKEYDSGSERSMEKTVQAFNIIAGKELTESEGWLFMEILKNVRQWTKPEYHEDSAVDGVAYSALKAESLSKQEASPFGCDIEKVTEIYKEQYTLNPEKEASRQ